MIVRSRLRRAIVLSAVATAVSAIGLPAIASASAPADTGAAPSSAAAHVIVVLRNQLTATPATHTRVAARRESARSTQDTVLDRLSGATPTHVVHYTVGNAFAATVTSAQAAELAADPAVARVVPDATVSLAPPTAQQLQSHAATPNAAAGPSAVDPRACSTDPAKPQLEPEALQTMHVRSSDPTAKTAAQLGIDGSGVKVGFIADGINPANKGFLRADGTSSIVDYKDFYGDGPNAQADGAEAFGDASSISAQGNVTYDVADYANPSVVSFPGGHCYIRIVGVAPGANVVALKAGSEQLPNSAILQSIDYAVTTAHVDVLNESFGGDITPDSSTRNLVQTFNDQAVQAGVTVVESSGDSGITSTIGADATDPLVISAGATTDNRLYEQTGYALATKFGNGTWQDSNISAVGSAGITQAGRTIDVSAPGETGWAVCDSGGRFVGCTSYGNPSHMLADIQAFGGTSQSSPFIAGVAALVIQAYRKTHGGGSPTPTVVKQIITSTAADLNLTGEEQGSGLVDARAAVEAASTWPGASSAAPAGTASNIALSTDQLTLEGAPGSTRTGSVTVTNVGTKSLTLAAAARRYAEADFAEQQVALSTKSTQTTPYPTNGLPWVYRTTTFTVQPGTDELRSFIRWNSGADYAGDGPVVRLSLFDPSGAFASNTRPQGGTKPANYGLATVRNPAAGKWTAVLYTSVAGGFTGPVTLGAQSLRAIPVGRVSPTTATLAPGASTTVSAALPVPASGGDTVDTISVASSDGHQVAVPVIVRSLVTADGRGTFSGDITGGNGRDPGDAQTFSYAFDVPDGKHGMQVGLTLAHNPGYLLKTALIDPNDEVQSVNSNLTVDAKDRVLQGHTLQNTVADPIAGRWRYVVLVQNPVPGTQDAEHFTGTLKFDQVTVTESGLPATLTAGRPTRRTVTVTNHGIAPLLLQADARTGRPVPQALAPLGASGTLTLPFDDDTALPTYLVPPDTTSLSLTAASSVPAQVELNAPLGGLDVFGDLATARAGGTISTATVGESTGFVGLGGWQPYMQQIGPFDGPAAPGTTTLSATATTRVIDRAVRSSTGDPFVQSFDPTVDPGRPVIVPPGGRVSFTLTITPRGARGTTAVGVLHLVQTPLITDLFPSTGEVLASVAYRYKIG